MNVNNVLKDVKPVNNLKIIAYNVMLIGKILLCVTAKKI